eukprot:gnl/TRDRNA2_/TRDRNA2_176817_c1_seq3.p2 gnl/TRDRNA2_/TRDRNA2_176817_c1~~gnl/TRDRNA2_/TRDRNA2_176817_c1_seq3.p2  ORF type:complete len:163 (+),score=16.10 gnl/TRDRNA2_/TRDRNA2_176817_c1_seq3:359-847(+)
MAPSWTEASPQHIANSARGYRMVARGGAHVIDAFAMQVCATAAEYDPRSSSNLVRARSVTKLKPEAVSTSVGESRAGCLSEFSPQNASNASWPSRVAQLHRHRPSTDTACREMAARSSEAVFDGRHSHAMLWTLWIASFAEVRSLEVALTSSPLRDVASDSQ